MWGRNKYLSPPESQDPEISGNLQGEESVKTSNPNSIPTNEIAVPEQNVENRKETVTFVRKLALSNLQKQANKKFDVSNANLVVEIGDTVRVRVP